MSRDEIIAHMEKTLREARSNERRLGVVAEQANHAHDVAREKRVMLEDLLRDAKEEVTKKP